MPIVINDNIPDFLREFLTSQGVISVRDTETGETGFVPAQPRRRPRPNTGGFEAAGGDDFDDPSLPEGTGSVDIFDTLKGLLSSDNTDPDFQAMLTDVANQELVGPPEQGVPMLDPNTGEYTHVRDVNFDEFNDLQSGLANTFLDRGYGSRGFLSPNYAGLVEMRGQDFYDRMSQPQSSGNSILDGAVNLFSGFGNFVDNSLSKIGGLFSGGISNPLDFDFDYTPSISDRHGPMGPLSAAATALSDPYLSTSQKIGQTLGGVLGAGASAVIPGANILGLLGVGLGRMGAHHDFDPSTDYNLNFDTRSGRTDWGSLSPGAGGVQYGSLSNENMIEDLAEKDPDFEISLNDGRDGYITAESWVAANEGLKAGNAAFGFNPDNPLAGYTQTDYFAAAADSSGGMFGKLGNQTVGDALTEYEATGTGAIQNIAGAAARERGLGYNDQQDLANALALGIKGTQAIAPEMSSMYDYNPDEDGIGTDFDAGEGWGLGTMGDMGFGEGDFGTDGII